MITSSHYFNSRTILHLKNNIFSLKPPTEIHFCNKLIHNNISGKNQNDFENHKVSTIVVNVIN